MTHKNVTVHSLKKTVCDCTSRRRGDVLVVVEVVVVIVFYFSIMAEITKAFCIH